MSWRQLTGALEPGQEIAILTHENPDGDSWGSALGLALVLEACGYRPRFARGGEKRTGLFSWLPGQRMMVFADGHPEIPDAAAVITLDCGDLSRVEIPVEQSRVLLNVDHHISNPLYGRINWVDFDAGATAQVLCGKIFSAGIQLEPDAATCFYTALSSDTGGFRFSNTGAETLRCASVLTDSGADISLIRRHLWENRPKSELALLREMMKSMTVLSGGAGALCALPYSVMTDAGALNAETDTALEVIRSVEGVEAVALLREMSPGKVKVSLRSKDYLDCAAFMAKLGGGGHKRAAGVTLNESFESVAGNFTRLLTEELDRGARGANDRGTDDRGPGDRGADDRGARVCDGRDPGARNAE